MTKTPSDLGIFARLLLRGVRAYQRAVNGRPTPCRYLPTCSNYALDAVEGHGALRGTVLTVRRLARCHPWGGQGWDPVPRRASSAHPESVLNADAIHE
ncbi:MAG: membrane protein insertion efficiency factor YidD [Acidimicrobiaceae bacterium]|nr:membrane protein insertion efficiency factor YidD [Acidimicrobiaceae bacterium]